MIATTKNLLEQTRLIIKHQKDVEELKGESFNIFSILNMERRETKAHTPFLAALLNPNGKHFKGNIFLQLFLDTIGYYQIEGINPLDIKTAIVNDNHYIGPVITTDTLDSGGSLDIFIQDKNKISITIENKIDADTEQPKQVVRYCNYNKPNNTVIYLTPFGTEPSEYSKGKLESNKDFYLISYKTHIITWLQKCLKEAAEQPILRETIRQYILLIQKITFSMDNQQERDLNTLMLEHFEEATFISNNFIPLVESIGEEIRLAVIKLLKETLDNQFNVYPGNNSSNINSQIWVKYKKHDSATLFYGIESFGWQKNEALKVGILNSQGKSTSYGSSDNAISSYWPYSHTISVFEEYIVDFNNGKTLFKLYKDDAFKSRFVKYLVDEFIKFINLHKQPLLEFLDKEAAE